MTAGSESDSPERQKLTAEIVRLTPGWLEARERAERDGRQNAWLNMEEQDAFRPIDRLLDQMIEVDLIGGNHD
jgi:hypothetical protein